MMLYCLILLFQLLFEANSAKLKLQQIVKAFPNFDQPPTDSTQIPAFRYTIPPLSRALFEINPLKKIRKPEFVQSIKYSDYNITRGELELLFDFADENNDDLLTHVEWDKFARLYSYPFEACDKDKNYVLSEEEFKTCYDVDPRNKSFNFRSWQEKDKIFLIHRTLRTRSDAQMTFFSYVYFRMAVWAWERCHSTNFFIAKSNYRCALETIFPIKFQSTVKFDEIYQNGLKFSNEKAMQELDFLAYLRITYYAYAFTVMGHPMSQAFIEKDSFIKAIREDRFPNNFEESDIEYMFYLVNNHPYHPVNEMPFSSFAFFYHYLSLFNWASKERPQQLNITEVNNIIYDPMTDYRLRLSLEQSRANFTEQEYLEGSLILQNLRVNPRNLFFEFKEKSTKQDGSVTTYADRYDYGHDISYYERKPPTGNTDFFFYIMTEVNKFYWTRKTFIRAFWLSNLFLSLCEDDRWLVSQTTFAQKLPVQYDSIYPPINLDQRRNYSIYKRIPPNIYLDLMTFLMLENFYHKISTTTVNNRTTIDEQLVKIVMKDYGMTKMPDSVLDVSFKGYDSLRKRIYDVYDTPFNLIVVQASTAELVRSNYDVAYYALKHNTDESRRFPQRPRRQMQSPFV